MGDESPGPVAGSFPYGFSDQNRPIRRLEKEGRTPIRWTGMPRPELAVMTNETGEPIYMDNYGNIAPDETVNSEAVSQHECPEDMDLPQPHGAGRKARRSRFPV